jgi:hypothetical protein
MRNRDEAIAMASNAPFIDAGPAARSPHHARIRRTGADLISSATRNS